MADERKAERRGLGRGLSALMADVNLSEPATDAEDAAGSDVRVLPIESITPNPAQPRRDFDEDELESLASSIRSKGVLQPLIVRPGNDELYQIVAGERRWRAAQRAQLHELPVMVRELSDTEVLEIAIVENIQRADLNPIEEATGYRRLMEDFGHTQERLAEALGKSRSHLANMLRLLTLPEDVVALVRAGDLSAGHARALITSESPSALARTVVARGLSVRETERLAKAAGQKTSKPKSPGSGEKDADTRALEADLTAALGGMRVSVDHSSGGSSGKLSISYGTLEQLDDLCRILSRG